MPYLVILLCLKMGLNFYLNQLGLIVTIRQIMVTFSKDIHLMLDIILMLLHLQFLILEFMTSWLRLTCH